MCGGTDKIPGTSGAFSACMIEFIQNVAVLALYIHYCKAWHLVFANSMQTVNTVLFGIYLFLSFVAVLFLFYAVVSSGRLKKRKRLCLRWLIFRVLSFIIPLAFLFASGDKTLAVICAVVVLMWVASISMVASFIFNLSDVIEGKVAGRPGNNNLIGPVNPVLPPKPKNIRPRRKSSEGIRPPGSLTDDHLRQLEEFQDYVRRTSWCSTWSASDEGGQRTSRTNSNTMTTVPGRASRSRTNSNTMSASQTQNPGPPMNFSRY